MVVGGEVGCSKSSQSLGFNRPLTHLQYNVVSTIILVCRGCSVDLAETVTRHLGRGGCDKSLEE